MIQPYYNQMYSQTNPYYNQPKITIDNNNNVIWVDGEVGADDRRKIST